MLHRLSLQILAIGFFLPLKLNKTFFNTPRQIFLFANNTTTQTKRQTILREQKNNLLIKLKQTAICKVASSQEKIIPKEINHFKQIFKRKKSINRFEDEKKTGPQCVHVWLTIPLACDM